MGQLLALPSSPGDQDAQDNHPANPLGLGHLYQYQGCSQGRWHLRALLLP
jgi:hypothetical protein